MGLLDFDYNKMPKRFKPPRVDNDEIEREEERLSELNNLGRKKVAKDFSDSVHLQN